MKRRIVLLGPPGSGKGTIAVLLQKTFGLRHVSSGHWLRREIETGTETGRKARLFIEKGELVPDDLVLEFMEQRLESLLPQDGFVLDGFPRTLRQAEALDEWLLERQVPIEAVLFCECSESVIVNRVTGRRICQNCGRGYHIRTMPPKVAGRCDDCGAGLIQRDDDTEQVIRQRLKVYKSLTEPLIAYYQRQGKIRTVDASQPSDTFYAASIEALTNDHFKE